MMCWKYNLMWFVFNSFDVFGTVREAGKTVDKNHVWVVILLLLRKSRRVETAN